MTIEEKLREEGKDKTLAVIKKLKKKFGDEKIDVNLTIKIMEKDMKELDKIEEAINEAEDIKEIKEIIE